jgi:hypothetical protein
MYRRSLPAEVPGGAFLRQKTATHAVKHTLKAVGTHTRDSGDNLNANHAGYALAENNYY